MAPPTAATASRSPSSPGLPPKVVARAKSVLAKLEAGRDATGGIAAGLDDLPLFAAAAEPEAADNPLTSALERDRAGQLSPREALEALYRLKELWLASTSVGRRAFQRRNARFSAEAVLAVSTSQS